MNVSKIHQEKWISFMYIGLFLTTHDLAVVFIKHMSLGEEQCLQMPYASI